MEALAALGLACNIVQLVSFCHETVELCSRMRDSSSKGCDLGANARKIAKIAEELRNSIKNTLNVVPDSGSKRELLSMANDCTSTAQKLIAELTKISGNKYLQLVQVLRKKPVLELLASELTSHQRTLQSGLIFQIWQKQDANRLRQQSSFSNLDSKIQNFMEQYLEGQADLKSLMSDNQTCQSIAAISSDITLLNKLIQEGQEENRQGFSELKTLVLSTRTPELKKARDQLLKSLYFPETNARLTAIDPAFPRTFEWMLKDSDDSDILEITDDEESESVSSDTKSPDGDRDGAIPKDDHVKADRPSPFRTWIQSNESMFWISGKAGSGKSTLMKFLVNDPRTLELLQEQNSSYTIYSYFLWNSGAAKMQRSLKGLLCTILYQVLSHDHDLANSILSQINCQTKLSPYDWETTEVKETLRTVLSLQNSHICIFIDGLDELDVGENPVDMRALMHNLVETKRVKLCVSSRPEPVWKHLLSDCYCITLQELTLQDMRLVATGKLSKAFKHVLNDENQEQLDRLTSTVVYKADGVFLWVHLVVNSLQRGFSQQDTFQDLYRRIDASPSKLEDLYQSMWDRLGDDRELYREQAAQIFNACLAWERLVQCSANREMKCFHLALALDASLQNKMLAGGKPFALSSAFLKACRTVEAKLESQCAGLLEFPRHKFNLFRAFENIRPALALKESDVRVQRIDFIHRTARDFILSTQYGRELRQSDDPEDMDYAIIKALICEASIYPNHCFRRSQGAHSKSEIFTWHKWGLESWRILEDAISGCVLIERPKTHKSTIELSLITDFLKTAFKKKMMGSFYEVAASKGFQLPIQHLLDSCKRSHAEHVAHLQSYLMWQRWLHAIEWRRDFYQDSFVEFLLQKGTDLRWRYFCTTETILQGIPQLLTFYESILLDGFDGINKLLHIDQNFHVLELFRKSSGSDQRKLFASFDFKDNNINKYNIKSGITLPAAYRGSETEDNPFSEEYDTKYVRCTTIIVGLNTAELLNRAVSNTLANTRYEESFVNDSEDVFAESRMTTSRKLELEQLLPKSEDCEFEILLVGGYNQSGSQENVGEKHTKGFYMGCICDGYRWRKGDWLVNKAVMPEVEEIRNCIHTLDNKGFSPERARYFRPTEAERRILLDKVIASDFDRPGFYSKTNSQKRKAQIGQIHDLVEEFMTKGTEPVADVAEWLLKHGYFIPTEKDIADYRMSDTMEERINILNRLNREAAAKEALHGQV